MKTVHATTYDLLRQHGLTTIFGNPGSNELPFLKDFPSDFRYVLGLHEGVVLGMADGFAQATRRPAFVNLHAAAGTGNAMGAMTNAVAAHSPLVITAGQQVRGMIGLEPMLTNVDASSLPRPLVKWSYEPASPQDVPRALSQAIHLASLPPNGPVYLSIPYDDWNEPAAAQSELLSRRTVSGATVPARAGHPSPSATGWRKLAVRYSCSAPMSTRHSPRPPRWHWRTSSVCLCGSRRRRPVARFRPRIRSFRGVLPAGIASLSRLLEGHDFVLVIGAPVFRYHQFEPGMFLAEGTEVVNITCDPQEAARAPMGNAVVADIRLTLEALGEAASVARRSMPEGRRKPPPAPETGEGAMAPEAVFDIVAEVAPQDAIYVNESTSTTNMLWDRLPMREPGSYFFPAAGGLGFGIPVALGVQLACPERRVIALIGDGSANFSITGLWTAAQHKIPAVFIILKNGTYGALRWFAEVLQVRDVPGLDVPGIDFCALAQGYGVRAVQADTPARLRDSLEGGPRRSGTGADRGPHAVSLIGRDALKQQNGGDEHD